MNEHPLNALPQGYRLQEYEFVRVLGFGGFGVTYLGFDHNLDKAAAIKEYQPADIAVRTKNHSIAPKASTFRDDFDWGLERFLDEARTLARFDHRNVIKVYRYFEANGTAYIVMEYAEGETLTAYLSRKGTLDEAELKKILLPILDGLETVHGADFLHRDIKPSNIVLRDEDSSPVLLDFGAARHAVGARSRSVTTIVTPAYAPIEQYSSRGNQGPWTDIYALGAVCYKALSGETPADSIDRLEHDPLEPVVKRCSGNGGRGFLQAIDWALKVKEGDRPQTITSWREAVLSARTTPQKVTPLAKSALQSHNTQRRLTRSNWIVVILFLTVVISGIVLSIQQELEQRAEEERRVAAVEAREARRAAEDARRAAAEAERERQARTTSAARRAAAEAERERQARAAEEARLAAEEAFRQSRAQAVEEARREADEAERQRQARTVERLGDSTSVNSTNLQSFTRGSHKDDVLRLQGTPDTIIKIGTGETWFYGSSHLEIDRAGRVVSWSDRGNLKVRLTPGRNVSGTAYFSRGSHRDDVLRLQGTPDTIIKIGTGETWFYGSSHLEIDRAGRVESWSNRGNLKVRLTPGRNVSGTAYFTRGSHRDDVLRLQGTPDTIIKIGTGETWFYGSSHLEIDRAGRVESWSNRGNLKVRMTPSQ